LFPCVSHRYKPARRRERQKDSKNYLGETLLFMSLQPLKNLQIPPRAATFSALVGLSGLLFGAMFLLGAGCKSAPPPDPMAEAAETGERPVAMKGEGNFFDGKIAATITISRGYSRGAGAYGGMARKGGGGGGGGHRQRDASESGLNESYNMGGYEEASETEQREMYEELVRLDRARRAAGSPMPPVTIRLKLANHGAESADVEVLELNSDLGNFAVRPTKLTLANGQPAEADPMVSQLGVTSDEIPVKVALRVGGKKETQVITVKNIFTAIEKEKEKGNAGK
jgi:hypothetical protein